ncbi:ABC transporter ATP-binding protein [Infirmifilum lucidum]|uniref:ABC transporter ATP-binding protein n=1 Tax=Infirmifilum lucidum TaxID=2776706 RepID=A0A7L9FGA6_9CREN|nr:ABC transporter ATP-binding protein [Infirmifilum lucidum]QOJ78848.1 ABC transporter ATP-binding protein [Infirmifilum lucidum]
MEVVVAEHLWKRFGPTVALRDVSLRVEEGVYLLLGPNGSGKSTMLKLVVGFLKPTRGRITVLGYTPWRDYTRLGERVAYAFEGMPLPWWMTGREFVEGYCRLRGCDDEMLAQACGRLGVLDYWDRPIFGYSSGMKKKLLLLMALAARADLYVLDEPFTLLDRKSLEETCSLIAQLPGKATLIATHIIPDPVKETKPSVIEFYEGTITNVRRE